MRTARNLLIAGLAGMVVSFLEKPLLDRIARHVERHELGAAYALVRQPGLRIAIAVVLMDYGLYIWHVLTHKLPFLWRCHLVHHVDLDMDASTAIRFHFGEMVLSIPWRLAQARLAGVTPRALAIWQGCLMASILFHHSNVRLPLALERRLSRLIATPRLHSIHHRPEWNCLNSNWSSGLAIWDLLHGTYCWREDGEWPIGVPGFERPEQVELTRCLEMPFASHEPSRLPPAKL